jgi:hypothetical protein
VDFQVVFSLVVTEYSDKEVTIVSDHLAASIFRVMRNEDGGCMVLQNVGFLPQHYTATHLRSTRLRFMF